MIHAVLARVPPDGLHVGESELQERVAGRQRVPSRSRARRSAGTACVTSTGSAAAKPSSTNGTVPARGSRRRRRREDSASCRKGLTVGGCLRVRSGAHISLQHARDGPLGARAAESSDHRVHRPLEAGAVLGCGDGDQPADPLVVVDAPEVRATPCSVTTSSMSDVEVAGGDDLHPGDDRRRARRVTERRGGGDDGYLCADNGTGREVGVAPDAGDMNRPPRR